MEQVNIFKYLPVFFYWHYRKRIANEECLSIKLKINKSFSGF